MTAKYGFVTQVYIDVKVLADLVAILDADHRLPPRTFSALIRQLLTELRDKYVQEEFRVNSVNAALDILDSTGFNTKQFAARERTLINIMAEENTKIENKPSSVETQMATAWLDGKFEGKTQEEIDTYKTQLNETKLAGIP